MSSHVPGARTDAAQCQGRRPDGIAGYVVPRADSLLPAPAPLRDDCALFLDVDGCLLEFDDDPSRVRAEPALLRCLDAVRHRLGGALALVSGRDIATLDAIFAPMAFASAGLHGLERRHAAHAAARPAPPSEESAAVAAVAADARAWLVEYPEARIEDKGRTLALHWRAAPGAERRVRAFAAQAIARLPGYEIQHGDHVLELRPTGADKGTAIAAFLLEPPFAGRVPMFAGDDLTDEHGFEVVNDRAGTSIIVGKRTPTLANHRLADPAAVRRWLQAST